MHVLRKCCLKQTSLPFVKRSTDLMVFKTQWKTWSFCADGHEQFLWNFSTMFDTTKSIKKTLRIHIGADDWTDERAIIGSAGMWVVFVPSRYIPAARHCSKRHLRQWWTGFLSTCALGASPGSITLLHLCLSSLPTFRLKKIWNITGKSVKLDLNLYYVYRPAVQAAKWLAGVRLSYIRNYRVQVLLSPYLVLT